MITSAASRHRQAAIVILSGLLMAGTLAHVTPAGAMNPSCQPPGASDYFAGAQSSFGYQLLQGVFGTLQQQQALLCSSDTSQTNGSSAWVMITGAQNSGYIQSGYTEHYAAGTNIFGEWNNYGADVQTNVPTYVIPIGQGTVYTYNVIRAYDSADCPGVQPCFSMRVGQQEFASTDPEFSYAWPQPWNVQIYAETHYYTSDVVGSYTPADFDNLSYLDMNYAQQPFYQSDLAEGTSSSYYHVTPLGYSCPAVPGTLCFQTYDG